MIPITTGRSIDPSGIDHPQHYNRHPSGVEAIDLMRYMPLSLGTAVKYLLRYSHKGDKLGDLKKSLWYLRDAHTSPVDTLRENRDKTVKLLDKVIQSSDDLGTIWGCLMVYFLSGEIYLVELAADDVDRLIRECEA